MRSPNRPFFSQQVDLENCPDHADEVGNQEANVGQHIAPAVTVLVRTCSMSRLTCVDWRVGHLQQVLSML